MLNGSVVVGRLAGTVVKVHWSALLITVVLGSMLMRDLGVVVGVVGVASFFVSILLHEASHAAMARRFGIGTTSIELWGLGGLARLEREPATPRADGWIAAAGPLSNAVLGGIVALATWISRLLDAPWSVSVSLLWFAVVNLGLAAFNILPGAPLDGGRILRAVRWSRHGERFRAMREAAMLGTVLGAGLVALGVSLLLNGHPGLWVIVSGAFILLSSRADTAAAWLGERIGPGKVADLTWYGVAEATADTDVNTMLWQHSRIGGAGVVAVRGARGTLDGVVFEDELWALPAERREGTELRAMMAPLDRVGRADVGDDLAPALMTVNPLRPVITVWRQGNLLGVIPPKVIREQLRQLLEASPA